MQGVETPGGFVPASFVVSNNDYYAMQVKLIPEEFRSIPGSIFLGLTSSGLSSSGFLMLFGVRKTFPYRSRLTGLLERQWGLQGLSKDTEVERIFHPGDIAEMSGSMYGALHGRPTG